MEGLSLITNIVFKKCQKTLIVPQEFYFPPLKSLEAQRHTIDTSCTQPSKLIRIFPFSIPHQIFPGKKKKDVLLQCLFLCIQYMYNHKLYNDKFYEHL